jgi:hypothetical protein
MATKKRKVARRRRPKAEQVAKRKVVNPAPSQSYTKNFYSAPELEKTMSEETWPLPRDNVAIIPALVLPRVRELYDKAIEAQKAYNDVMSYVLPSIGVDQKKLKHINVTNGVVKYSA